ncbi:MULTISPECIES: hypothetical protein [unclassified Rhizobium]|uniref:hypothetical protein n=1 Tax=unclassified Rhizobium TaxID=2613769 RepID=UPI0013C406A0|nr:MULTISPECIES: hypothetical protein [unclassified Rhizobium]
MKIKMVAAAVVACMAVQRRQSNWNHQSPPRRKRVVFPTIIRRVPAIHPLFFDFFNGERSARAEAPGESNDLAAIRDRLSKHGQLTARLYGVLVASIL